MRSIAELRKEVDEVDDKLIQLLLERFELTDDIGKVKVKGGIPLEHELGREAEIVERLSKKYSKTFISELYAVLFDEALKRQKELSSPLQ